MPWKSIDELRASATYKTNDALKTMSKRQLERFLSVFNAVHARITAGGGDTAQAEATAFALAYTTAKRANAALERSLEPEVHFFAAMAPEMFGAEPGTGAPTGHKLDYSWILDNPDLLNLAVAGNEFNWNHDQTHTSLGQLRGIVLTKDAPKHIREKTQKDVPFLFVASYYDDVDPDVKSIDTISAEWATIGEKDGIETPLPLSFAVTREPQNDPALGVIRVASWAPKEKELASFLASLTAPMKTEEAKSPRRTYKEARAAMPQGSETEQKELQQQVASLREQLKDYETLKQTVASLKDLAPLKEAIASLGKNAETDPKTVLVTVEASLKQLSEEKTKLSEQVASIQKQFDALSLERAKEIATNFASVLLKEGKIKADQTERWASLFLKDEKMAKELAAGLVATSLGEGEGKGAGPADLKESEASLLLAEIDPRLKKTKGGEN